MPKTIPNRSLLTVLLMGWVSLLMSAASCGRSAMAAAPFVAAPAQLPVQVQVPVPEAAGDDPEIIGLAESLHLGTPQPRAPQPGRKARTSRR